ncbi:MAG: hypothetical protein P9L94_02095 [Candidatus Hinthialibacter antarcticus]|nr:hypothetical protein [Candidatus Hinthialibacter antarcticus]
MKKALIALSAILVVSSVATAQHFALGPDWVAGQGTYVIVDDGGNRVLVGAATNGADPKHAWVNQQFGNSYTVKCDVRMDSWADAQDLSRAGIAVQITPDGVATDGGGDRGLNLLLHDTIGNVQFLSDNRAWGDNAAFAWEVGVWYTFELSIDNGVLNGSIMTTGGDDALVLDEWVGFAGDTDRVDGFAGITPSTKVGLMASYDNFEVSSGGNVVFSDDFEGTAPVKNTLGLSSAWVGGEAGYYVVDGGQLYAIATNGVDPKHAWYKEELAGGATITADINMLSWDEDNDASRAGLAVNIQPNGTALDGDHDRGNNILFHQTLGRTQFLNDLRGWGPEVAIEWVTETSYPMSISTDGTNLVGSIAGSELASWPIPDPQNRADGFAGVTASTLTGLIAAYDNVVISDAAGNVVFSDDFEVFVSSSNDWEVYE